MAAITKNHQNGYHGSKTEHHAVWANFKLKPVFGHLACQPLQEIIKMVTMALPIKIETCNEKSSPFNLGQSST